MGALLASGCGPSAEEKTREALREIVRSGDMRLVQKALAGRRYVDYDDLIRTAVACGHERILDHLLARAGKELTPEYLAELLYPNVGYGNLEAMELLLGRGADPNQPPPSPDARYGKAGPLDETSPLTCAAVEGRPHAAALLIEHGADVNGADPTYGKTALHWTALGSHYRMAKDWAFGYQISREPPRFDWAAAEAAAELEPWHQLKLAKLLLAAGADPNIQDNQGNTPLHYAAKRREVVYREWVEPDQWAEYRQEFEDAPYGWKSDDTEFVRLLLENGADPTIENEAAQTPIDLATTRPVAELLKASKGESPGPPPGRD